MSKSELLSEARSQYLEAEDANDVIYWAAIKTIKETNILRWTKANRAYYKRLDEIRALEDE